jgi:hypothetical protein
MDPPLSSRKQTPEYRMYTSDIASQKEVQNSTIGRKSDTDSVEMHKGQFCNTTKRGIYQQTASIRVKCFRSDEVIYLNQTLRTTAERYHNVA